MSVQHVLFAMRPDLTGQIKDSESLVQSSLKLDFIVGYLRGSKKSEALIDKLPLKNRHQFNTTSEAFRWLQNDRIGAFIGGPGMVSRANLNAEFSNSGIHEVTVLTETPLYPYLHSKHAALIPKIQQALKAMQEDGTLQEIRNSIK